MRVCYFFTAKTLGTFTPFPFPFWLSHILVYIFYFCPSFEINKAMAKTEKGHENAVTV